MLQSEQRDCQNCKNQFTIEPEDFGFYRKMDVPPPTFCPQCRLQRRMSWRNERTLHKSQCQATGKDIITMFSLESGVKVYDHDYWWSDKWDDSLSGKDYDFSRSFFEQFRDLMHEAPLPNLANTNTPGSEYGNHNAECKNCYLIFASYLAEDSFYSEGLEESKGCMDIYKGAKIEQNYETVLCARTSKLFWSYDTGDGFNSSFVDACLGVQDCLGCVNLRNKSHFIFNKPYSKEEYQEKMQKYDFGSYKNLEAFKREFQEFKKDFPIKGPNIAHSVDSTGDHVGDAKNCKFCFDGYGGTEDCKYMFHVAMVKDSYDGFGAGLGELFYECVDSGINAAELKFVVYVHRCLRAQYAYGCHSSKDIFGCVGLKNKQYCILNKQYTKEEYEEILPKIIQHMYDMPYIDRKGRIYKYGEFFPQEISPFGYNETIAQEYFSILADEAQENGYSWRDLSKKEYKTTLKSVDLPDHIKDVPEDILNEIIECEHGGECKEQCTSAFRIIQDELAFYKRYNLPLPRLCPNCRHYARLRQRYPFNLWKRTCMCEGRNGGNYINLSLHAHGTEKCGNIFETACPPDREDVLYCEHCYQAEVA